SGKGFFEHGVDTPPQQRTDLTVGCADDLRPIRETSPAPWLSLGMTQVSRECVQSKRPRLSDPNPSWRVQNAARLSLRSKGSVKLNLLNQRRQANVAGCVSPRFPGC